MRALLDDRAAHPDGGFFSEAEWLVYLLRAGRNDLAREFQSLPGWEIPYEVLTALAEHGHAGLMETGGDHNWALGEDLIELARRATPPVRPPTPTDDAGDRALARAGGLHGEDLGVVAVRRGEALAFDALDQDLLGVRP